MEYSHSLLEHSGSTESHATAHSSALGGYPEGSVAKVTYDEGYSTNGDVVTCQNGKWGDDLPECTSELLFAYTM